VHSVRLDSESNVLPSRARAIAHDSGPYARWRSGEYLSLAVNYSAGVKHAMNQPVHVRSHVPVLSLDGH